MILGKLRHRESSDIVASFLSCFYSKLDQPLDDRIDRDEVQPLYLMRLQAMGTLHTRQHSHDLLCESTVQGKVHIASVTEALKIVQHR